MKINNFLYWGAFLFVVLLAHAAEDRVFHAPDGSVSGPGDSPACQTVASHMQSIKKDPWIVASNIAFDDATIAGDLGASTVEGKIGAHPARYMHTPQQDVIAISSLMSAKTLQEANDACNAMAPRGQWKLPNIKNDAEREIAMRMNAPNYKKSSGYGFGAVWIDGIDPNDPNLVRDQAISQKYPDKKDWVLAQSGVGFSLAAMPIPHAVDTFTKHIQSTNKYVYGKDYKEGLKPLVAALNQGPAVICVQSRMLSP